jgi:hypothetical protein
MTSEKRYVERDQRLGFSIRHLQVPGPALLNRQRKTPAGPSAVETQNTLRPLDRFLSAEDPTAQLMLCILLRRPAAEIRNRFPSFVRPSLPRGAGSARLRCWDGAGQKKGQYALVTVVARDLK